MFCSWPPSASPMPLYVQFEMKSQMDSPIYLNKIQIFRVFGLIKKNGLLASNGMKTNIFKLLGICVCRASSESESEKQNVKQNESIFAFEMSTELLILVSN